MLVSLKELMADACEKGYAVGAFNTPNLESLIAIIKAAEETGHGVILNHAEVHFPLIPIEEIGPIMVKYAKEASVPVCVHLDHGESIETCMKAIKLGFTSVMLDASAKVFEENVALSAEAAAIAHAANISLEAELGHVSGGDGGDGASALTVPAEVREFVRRTEVDCLAVSIGTIHGDYHGEPKLHLDLLKEITEITDVPLVLHGGSGTPVDQLHAAIKLGIAKINICTDIHKAFLRGMEEAKAERTPSVPGNYYIPACEYMFNKTVEMIKLFSEGRFSK